MRRTLSLQYSENTLDHTAIEALIMQLQKTLFLITWSMRRTLSLQYSNNKLDHTAIEALIMQQQKTFLITWSMRSTLSLQYSENTLDHIAIEALIMQLQKTHFLITWSMRSTLSLQYSNNALDHTAIEAHHATTKNLSHHLVNEKHSVTTVQWEYTRLAIEAHISYKKTLINWSLRSTPLYYCTLTMH